SAIDTSHARTTDVSLKAGQISSSTPTRSSLFEREPTGTIRPFSRESVRRSASTGSSSQRRSAAGPASRPATCSGSNPRAERNRDPAARSCREDCDDRGSSCELNGPWLPYVSVPGDDPCCSAGSARTPDPGGGHVSVAASGASQAEAELASR